jgi:hypothetical protein
MTTGMPISLSNLRHSSLCSRVTLTVRREKRSTSSAVPRETMHCEPQDKEQTWSSPPVSLASSPSAFASSPSAFASSRLSNRFASYNVTPLVPTMCEGEKIKAHYSGLEIWRLAVENIGGLDSIFDDPDGAIEESHQMAMTNIQHIRGRSGICIVYIRTWSSPLHRSLAARHPSGVRQ